MNEDEARKILGDCVQADNSLHTRSDDGLCMSWESDIPCHTICLNDCFTIEQVEAIAWWMRNKKV